MKPLRRAYFTLLVLAPLSIASLGQAPASKPASKPASRPTAEQAVDARAWVAAPAKDEKLDAYAPAAEMRYREYVKPRPQRVWIAKIDLTAPGVRFAVTEPAQFQGDDSKFETRCANTLEFAQQTGVQFAFNTSAFSPFRARMGQPMNVIGLAATEGRSYSEPEKENGALYIWKSGRVALKGPPLPRDEIWTVVPGFRMLLDDGQIIVSDHEANTDFGNVNPRTAVGADKDGTTLWVVVADGRQKGVAAGWTLVELACLFESLGCWDALNLDGGGSSTFVLEDKLGEHRVINTPVGNKIPGSLREVAHNVGVFLPGPRLEAAKSPPEDIRAAVVRIAATSPRGPLKTGGIHADIVYGGTPVATINTNEGELPDELVTLYAVLDGYRLAYGLAERRGADNRWFADMPGLSFQAFVNLWLGKTPGGVLADAPPLPQGGEERRAAAALAWAGLASIEPDWRGLRRGDVIHFWRKNGTPQTAIFWGHDRDEAGRVRIMYWSGMNNPRYEYPLVDGGPAVKVPGAGLNWEYLGDEIDPARFYGAVWRTPRDEAAATQPAPTLPTATQPGASPTPATAPSPASAPASRPAAGPASRPAATQSVRPRPSSQPAKRTAKNSSGAAAKRLPTPEPRTASQPASQP